MLFTWCSEASKASVLNENEVFAFFNDKINANELNVQNLPVEGFTFLSNLFIGENVSSDKLFKYAEMSKHKKRHVNLTDQDSIFEVKVDPKQLLSYKMIWEFVLQS